MKVTEAYIKKLVEDALEEEELGSVLREGMWDKIKYKMAKLGSLEKGGKMYLPKKGGKVVQATEDELQGFVQQYDQQLGKLSKGLVATLVKNLGEEFPEFPNMEASKEFGAGIVYIATAYDSLAQAVDKYVPGGPPEKQPEGAMDPVTANGVVKALRAYVSQTLDYKLADVYKHFKENFDHLSVEDHMLLAELNLSEEEEKELLRTKYGEKGSVQKGLESKLLPIIMNLVGGMGAGAGAMLLGMAKDPEMAAQLVQVSSQGEEAVTEFVEGAATETIQQSTKGHGLLWALNQAGHGGEAGIYELQANIDSIAEATGNSPEDVIQDFAGEAGKHSMGREALQTLYDYQAQGGDLKKVIVAGVPSDEFEQFVTSNSDKYGQDIANTLNTEGAWSGANKGSVLAINPVSWTIAAKKILVPVIIKAAPVLKTISMTRRVGTAAAAMGAGAALAQAGVVLALGGVLVGFLRKKGLSKSRAADLMNLEKELKDFEIPTELQPVSAPEPQDEPEPEEEPAQPDPEDLPGGPPAPDPTEPQEPAPPGPPPTDKTRIGLARMDDDGTKIHVSKARSGQGRERARDLFGKAQDQGVVGASGTPFGDPIHTDREAPGGLKQKGVWQAPSSPDPDGLTYNQISKAIKGKSRYDAEPYISVDASVTNDVVAALRKQGYSQKQGVPPKGTPDLNGRTKKVAQRLLKTLVKNKKKATPKQAASAVKQSIKLPGGAITDEAVAAIVNVLNAYGLVAGEEEMKARKTKKKKDPTQQARPAPEEEPQGRQRGLGSFTTAGPETGVRESLNEQLERWHTLAGVKK